MKPDGAISVRVNCDFCDASFEDALESLKVPIPLVEIHVHPRNYKYAKKTQSAFWSPNTVIHVDETLNPYEWYVSWNGKTIWSPGA